MSSAADGTGAGRGGGASEQGRRAPGGADPRTRAGAFAIPPRTWAALAAGLFAAECVYLFLHFLSFPLWEDGYFFIRYAYNAWHHGVMGWNVADGPLYGMTSQLYQLLITLVYPLAPHHVVTSMKVISALSLFGAYVALIRLPVGTNHRAARLALPFVALSLPILLGHFNTGLETLVVLPWLALWLHLYIRYRDGRCGVATMTLLIVGTYLLRPDAVLIPLVALLPELRDQRARTLKLYACAVAALLVCLGVLRLYYGTALPLSFYIKTFLTTPQSHAHVAVFFKEKVKNISQFVYFTAPFVLITVVGRNRIGLALLGAAAVFASYHAIFTVETMGQFSRFYMPAFVPIVAAAMLSWPRFRERAPRWLPIVFVLVWVGVYPHLKSIDRESRVFIFIRAACEYPYLVAMSLLLLPLPRLRRALATLAVAVVFGSTLVNYPIKSVTLRDDVAILLKEIAPRPVFRGIRPLRLLHPRQVYHTDMGAPGLLFPEARVTDLDGLLNKEITLEGKTFSELCRRDHPDAIFFPNRTYPQLRRQIRASRCFRNYRHVLPGTSSRLYVRDDLFARYRAAVRALHMKW